MLIGGSSRSPVADAPMSPKYSDRLSPAINQYLSEASRQEVRVYVIILSFFKFYGKIMFYNFIACSQKIYIIYF